MKKPFSFFNLFLLGVVLTISRANTSPDEAAKEISKDRLNKNIIRADWGERDGKKVYLYTLTNKKGSQVTITNYGGIITSWITVDKSGNKSGIIVGFDSLQAYLPQSSHFGATIGRYGNRIGNAQFKIDTVTYKLAANDGKNHLHGGRKGFDKVVWDSSPAKDGSSSLTLTYLSKDGEEGYPGNLNVTVNYTLTDKDELLIDYAATTDKTTPVNLTNHSYFNLTGDVAATILDNSLTIDADNYTPVDRGLIPTGEINGVKGTPFDFTTPHKIGERIAGIPGGYDHNFVLNRKNNSLEKIASLADSVSGRTLDVYTTEPGLQFYSGNFLNGNFINRTGTPIKKYTALCLETQHYPDSPNKPAFPSTLLKPGDKYHTVTKYVLSIKK